MKPQKRVLVLKAPLTWILIDEDIKNTLEVDEINDDF